MEWRCPTCRAPYRGGSQCYRCQTDLSKLLVIQDQAAELKRRAVCLLRERKPGEARQAIRQSLLLLRDPDAEKVEALIMAAEGDFGQVLAFLK
ncbi:MAG: hypothetical protein AB1611_00475 [bacterium]